MNVAFDQNATGHGEQGPQQQNKRNVFGNDGMGHGVHGFTRAINDGEWNQEQQSPCGSDFAKTVVPHFGRKQGE